MVSSKICFKCNTNQALTEFYKHPGMSDGHVNKCKTCNKKDVSENRLAKIEKYRAYDRERAKNPERAKAAAAINKIWRNSDSRIMSCHNKVSRAVRSGLLITKPCSVCGSENSVAHHESYNKPLDVVWLCQVHHKARHKEMAILGIDPLENEDA